MELAELEHTQICPLCKREGDIEPAEHTCGRCEKPMCFSHSNKHETEGRFCDDCLAE